MAADKTTKKTLVDRVNEVAAEITFSKLAKEKIGEQKLSQEKKEEVLYALLAEMKGFSDDVITKIQDDIMLYPLAKSKMDRKMDEIVDALYRSKKLSFLALVNGDADERLISVEQHTDSEQMINYNSVAFAEALMDSLDDYANMVYDGNKKQNYFQLFSSYYRIKNQGTKAEHLNEIYGATADYIKDSICGYLSELSNIPPSEIERMANVLNKEKCYRLAKRLLKLEETQELPLKVKNELNNIYKVSVQSLDEEYEDSDGNVMDDSARNLSEIIRSDDNRDLKDDLVGRILDLLDKAGSKRTKDYIYYQMLVNNDLTEGDLSGILLSKIPNKIEKFYQNFGEERNNANAFFGSYWDLRPDSTRKEIEKIKKYIVKQTERELKHPRQITIKISFSPKNK